MDFCQDKQPISNVSRKDICSLLFCFQVCIFCRKDVSYSTSRFTGKPLYLCFSMPPLMGKVISMHILWKKEKTRWYHILQVPRDAVFKSLQQRDTNCGKLVSTAVTSALAFGLYVTGGDADLEKRRSYSVVAFWVDCHLGTSGRFTRFSAITIFEYLPKSMGN